MRFLACFHRRQPELTGEKGKRQLGNCVTAPPLAMPPMVSEGMQQQQRSMGSKPSSPVRFTSDERKAMLTELALLEDISVRAVRDACCYRSAFSYS
jgi:hypothetical protein